MLTLRHNPRFDFRSSRRGVQHKFALSPVVAESDELIDEITNSQEKAWELMDQSGEQLETFWDTVLTDVRKDPEWAKFANDDEF